MDIRHLLATVGVLISIGAAVPYIRDIAARKTKPHLITWLIWTILAAAGCIIQLIGGGAWGAAVLGATAALNVVILILTAMYVGKDHITRFDTFIFGFALVSFILWLISSNPTIAAVLVTFTMAMGYIPTYKKSFTDPRHESVSLFFWSGIKQVVGIAALSAYNVLTLVFPIFLIFANFGLVTLLFIRRNKLQVR